MVTVKELYGQLLMNGCENTRKLIKYLVEERKIMKWEDDSDNFRISRKDGKINIAWK